MCVVKVVGFVLEDSMSGGKGGEEGEDRKDRDRPRGDGHCG